MDDNYVPPSPLVSVLMATYNGERFLRLALESILNQTFSGFELIVVDDGSTDGTPRILGDINDNRLIVVTNESNLGIAAANNKGLALARGKYIALQDHDDISLPHRFQTQVAYLNAHPEIALIGSGAILIDENGAAYDDYIEPEDDIELKWEALFRCPISHTSVMVRRQVISDMGGYSPNPVVKVASDYDLLSRIVMRYRVANLSERLVMWRRHTSATSVTQEPQQIEGCESISLRNICMLVSSTTCAECDLARRTYGVEEGARACTSPGIERECYQQPLFLSCRAFVATPAGRFPSLPAEQVISGLRFLSELQSTFSRVYDPPRSAVARLRSRLNWTWGKHAVALAIRTTWDWRSRMRIFLAGLRCLRSAMIPGGGR